MSINNQNQVNRRMNILNQNGFSLIFIFVYLLMVSNFDDKVNADNRTPLVINTWNFREATESGWTALNMPNGNVFDSIVSGCSKCEEIQCDGSVGYGSHPDEAGHVSLDAMIMDGKTKNVGAVASMRNVKNAIQVARKVLENTQHSLIVGDSATEFAQKMGFKLEPLETENSNKQYRDWLSRKCQPNFWLLPDSSSSCGPYNPTSSMIENQDSHSAETLDIRNHDTIGMIAIDANKNIAAGTSTNGASHRIPGRVGDTAIPGSGAYADNSFGAAVATGDGDVIMRDSPSRIAVFLLEQNKTPTEAAYEALKRVYDKYPNNQAAIVVVNKEGDFGASCFGMKIFPYSFRNNELNQVQTHHIECFDNNRNLD